MPLNTEAPQLAPYFPRPDLTAAQAADLLDRTVRQFVDDALTRFRLGREVEEAFKSGPPMPKTRTPGTWSTDELRLLDEADDETRQDLLDMKRRERETGRLGEPEQIVAAPRWTRAKAQKLVLDRKGMTSLPLSRRLLVTGSQGLGKTDKAAEVLAAIREPVTVLYLVPTHVNVWEFAKTYRRFAGPGSLPLVPVRGRSAPARIPTDEELELELEADPTEAEKAEEERMCQRHETVAKATSAGVDIAKAICRSCPMAATCAYRAQTAAIDEAVMDGNGVLLVMAHEYATTPVRIGTPDIVVIDERLDGLERVLAFDPALLEHLPEPMLKHERAGHHAPTLRKLRDTLVRTPGAERQAVLAEFDRFELRETLAWLRSFNATPEVNGGMDDDVIEELVDELREFRSHLWNLVALMRAIDDEWDVPALADGTSRASYRGVVYRPGRKNYWGTELPPLTVHYLTRLRIGAEVPLLLLDGTGDVGLNRVVFGDALEHVRIAAERQAHVTGTVGSEWSRMKLTAKTSSSPSATPISEKADEQARALRKKLIAFADEKAKETFVVGSKAAIAALVADGLKSRAGWFGAVRGKNRWKQCRRAIVVGREEPQLAALEDMGRCYAVTTAEAYPSVADQSKEELAKLRQPRGRRMRDGSVQQIDVFVHPDRLTQAVLEQIREAEAVQAVDRVRAIWQSGREIILLNNLSLDVTYDRCLTGNQIWRGGNRFDVALNRFPVLPLPYSGNEVIGRLIEGSSDLWPTVREWKHWLEREKPLQDVVLHPEKKPLMQAGSNVVRVLWGRGSQHRVIEFRVAGAPGRPSRAVVDVRRVHDPLPILAELFGKPIACWQEIGELNAKADYRAWLEEFDPADFELSEIQELATEAVRHPFARHPAIAI